jgi:hypothetical protein
MNITSQEVLSKTIAQMKIRVKHLAKIFLREFFRLDNGGLKVYDPSIKLVR